MGDGAGSEVDRQERKRKVEVKAEEKSRRGGGRR
jgi:hypothetical protein